jgi:hypothetical protein
MVEHHGQETKSDGHRTSASATSITMNHSSFKYTRGGRREYNIHPSTIADFPPPPAATSENKNHFLVPAFCLVSSCTELIHNQVSIPNKQMLLVCLN